MCFFAVLAAMSAIKMFTALDVIWTAARALDQRHASPRNRAQRGVHDGVQVKGWLERNGSKLDAPRIQGKWDDAMYAEMADGSQQLLWKISPMPANPTR